MALVNCPECDGQVSDQAPMCLHGGYPIRGGYGYECRSERQLFGLPLVQIMGVHALGGNVQDPNMVEFFRNRFHLYGGGR